MKRWIETFIRARGYPPHIYVAGKYTGVSKRDVTRNIRAAEQGGLQVCAMGAYPIVPHCNTSHPSYSALQSYDFFMVNTLRQLRQCDAIYMLELWYDSRGACKEHSFAHAVYLPMFFQLTEREKTDDFGP